MIPACDSHAVAVCVRIGVSLPRWRTFSSTTGMSSNHFFGASRSPASATDSLFLPVAESGVLERSDAATGSSAGAGAGVSGAVGVSAGASPSSAPAPPPNPSVTGGGGGGGIGGSERPPSSLMGLGKQRLGSPRARLASVALLAALTVHRLSETPAGILCGRR
jgi:hypothetical protein